MTEDEYIFMSNRAKIETAFTLLCDVMASDTENWGVKKGDLPDAIEQIGRVKEKLFNATKIDEF